MSCLAVNHVGIRCTKQAAMEHFYTNVLGLRPHPEKHNWLAVGDTYALHLMPAYTDDPGAAQSDPANHFAIQTDDLRLIVGKLLSAGSAPYQLDLNLNPPRYLKSADEDLSYGLGTVFVNDPDGNVVEFVDVTKGIFKQFNYKVQNQEAVP